ncbi:MAG: methyltransferase domain-containing protein, partial [Lachnospiraceae bacterium]|nr:methyltransferase domain-containing protein [Lachnospiraceae bacterium]
MKNVTSGIGTYQAYTGFAEVYDRFMENVPYDDWEAWIASRLESEGYAGQLVLELGCGTGIMTERLAARGYDMIGVDLSEDMLAEAMEKRSLSGHNILYLQQDMREFELYGTVAAVVCICDSLNYITARRDLAQVFRLVNNYLDPGGLFLFDFNTPAA